MPLVRCSLLLHELHVGRALSVAETPVVFVKGLVHCFVLGHVRAGLSKLIVAMLDVDLVLADHLGQMVYLRFLSGNVDAEIVLVLLGGLVAGGKLKDLVDVDGA
eukprot:13668719-Heterocapsa_arctica.AAC.1